MSNTVQTTGVGGFLASRYGKMVVSLVALIAVLVVLVQGFLYMRDAVLSRLAIAILALVMGIGGIWALLASLNFFVESLGERARVKLRPFVFAGPAVLVLGIYIVYPALRTLYISFLDRTSTMFVGLRNYAFIFTDPDMIIILRNTLGWVIVVPVVAVTFGLLIAVMTDRLSSTMEKVTKSLIFLPLAISFVGASVIWRFVYYYQPPGSEQIGLLNAVVTALGGDPVAWLLIRPWNNLFLMFIMVWLQTGFAMVILSASVKGVPKDLLEAARIDGAGEIRVFFNVTVPYISGTILTVWTTILFLVLKIFDIVYVMTSGRFETGIVASRFYEEAFVFRNFGRGAALAVFLFIVVIPFMIQNVRSMQERRR
ncbi:MAG: carbohydrate ABC transporter permease [Spirochaetaceae bacterium]